MSHMIHTYVTYDTQPQQRVKLVTNILVSVARYPVGTHSIASNAGSTVTSHYN